VSHIVLGGVAWLAALLYLLCMFMRIDMRSYGMAGFYFVVAWAQLLFAFLVASHAFA
jgi:hypothetical protein